MPIVAFPHRQEFICLLLALLTIQDLAAGWDSIFLSTDSLGPGQMPVT